MTDDAWEQRLAEVWTTYDAVPEAEFLSAVDALVAELPDDDPVGLFERGGALDSCGHPDRAVPLYRRALATGLDGERRRRATLSLASSLRNIGRPAESVALLTAELDCGSDHLDDAVRAFLALALVDVGREREAVSVALTALAPRLPRYQRSVANYARLLIAPGDRAEEAALGQAPGMTTPEPETPQPRDIALEQETSEQADDLEAQSEPASDEVS